VQANGAGPDAPTTTGHQQRPRTSSEHGEPATIQLRALLQQLSAVKTALGSVTDLAENR
jgi:hypothetical protein